MDLIEALHSAARQYCSERAAFLREQYSRLHAAGRATIEKGGGQWTYTREAYDIFPRYQALEAIQDEVEHFLPNHFVSLDEGRSILALAGETAQSVMSRQTDPTAIAADFEERQLFSNFVRGVDGARLSQQQTLPFRRVLGDGEHQAMHADLADKWGKWYGGACDRMSPESEVVTLHTAVMEFPGSYSGLRAALVEHGVGRLFELREHGCGFEIPVELTGFTYNGAEGFWTNGAYDWLVYASHEASITFGSPWLVAKMREILPEFSRYITRAGTSRHMRKVKVKQPLAIGSYLLAGSNPTEVDRSQELEDRSQKRKVGNSKSNGKSNRKTLNHRGHIKATGHRQ